MPKLPIRPTPSSKPSLVQPFLNALDRLQARETIRPDQLTARAAAMLDDRFGTSPEIASVAFAHGCVELMAHHTHYFDGFALVVPLRQGIAVALRESSQDASSVAFEDLPEQLALSDTSAKQPSTSVVDAATVVLARLAEALAPGSAFEVAIVSTFPAGLGEVYLSTLSVAFVRVLQERLALALSNAEVYALVSAHLATTLGRPFGVAFPLAADIGRPGSYLLLDTKTLEHLAVEGPTGTPWGWGLLDTGGEALPKRATIQTRKQQADEAAVRLQKRGLSHVGSLRDIEHQELEQALKLVPRGYRTTLRYLVKANAHVQKLIVAIRHGDGQMLGALLNIAYAMQHAGWCPAEKRVDFVVDYLEQLALDGIHGARRLGETGAVVFIGLPFTVPRAVDSLREAYAASFDKHPLDAMLI